MGKSSDITSMEWIGEPQKCTKNLTNKITPWLHPGFTFKVPVHAVRIRLSEQFPVKGKKLWDVIFAGKPGNDYTIRQDAAPAGGKMPLFPEFCPPLPPDATYTLHLTEAENEDWDEKLTLVSAAAAGNVRIRGKQPRLSLHTRTDIDGPVDQDQEDSEDTDEATDTPPKSVVEEAAMSGSLLLTLAT